MYNIVTIDFDIIMAPSIMLYNNMVGPGKWEEDFMNNPQLALSTADLQHYQVLMQWLLKTVPVMSKENIHFIFDHEKIINFLPETEDDIIITNIDHHHDVVYEDSHKKEKITKDNLTCGNWVKYIADNKNLLRYNWICNGNSERVDKNFAHLVTSTVDLREYNFNNLSTPDCLIICLSPFWIPPTYRPLFYTILDVCNFIHHHHYDFEE